MDILSIIKNFNCLNKKILKGNIKLPKKHLLISMDVVFEAHSKSRKYLAIFISVHILIAIYIENWSKRESSKL